LFTLQFIDFYRFKVIFIHNGYLSFAQHFVDFVVSCHRNNNTTMCQRRKHHSTVLFALHYISSVSWWIFNIFYDSIEYTLYERWM